MSWKFAVQALIYIARNWYYYWEKVLTIIGNIKVFKTPFFIQYSPEEFDYKVRGEQIEKIMSVLRPGDIVLRRYDHYLDSALIPGDYSHSSVYIGGKKIIHAVAEGVKEIHVIDFCQADGICVMRPKCGQRTAVNRVKKWVGKHYDFKFNSTDSSEFYCHELSATAYKDFIKIEAITPIFCGMKLKFLKKKFLAESFIENPDFTKVIEV